MKYSALLAPCLCLASFISGAPEASQRSLIQQKPFLRHVNESPNAGYGFRLLPAAWSKAAQNPLLAAALAGTALGGTAYALYSGFKNNPCRTLQTLAAALAVGTTGWLAATHVAPNLYFLNVSEENLKTENLIFPERFLFGTGGSSYQIEGVGPDNGGEDSSTYALSYRTALLDAIQQEIKTAERNDNTKEVRRLTALLKDLVKLFAEIFKEPVGLACNDWNVYAQDAQLKADKGVTADRFSIERFKVETLKGVYNQPAIAHYQDKAVMLIRHNIRPIIGMHHYTDPQWFMQDGGFENSENAAGFIAYCATITKAIYDACVQEIARKEAEAQTQGLTISYQHLLPLFYTYNSANAYAINGYQQGTRPPYVKSMSRFRNVLFNMLDAHVGAYKAMKQVAPQALIGTTINVYQLDPVNHRHPVQRLLCFAGNYLQNYCVYDFFKKYADRGEKVLDWVGLNYYSHGYMNSPAGPFSYPQDCTGSSPHALTSQELTTSKFSTANELYTIYADGLFLALHEINDSVAKPAGGIPIIITETGFGVDHASPEETPNDILKRELFLKHYLYATSQAHQVGIPVIGISIWSFMDNYEWGTYNKRYGLFGVDFNDPTRPRIPKMGAQYYWDVIRTHKKG